MDKEETADVAGKQHAEGSGKSLVATPMIAYAYHAEESTILAREVALSGSPRWEIEDEFLGPLSAIHGIVGASGEDGEEVLPPLSQGEAVRAIVGDTATSGKEGQHERGTDGKATPSTLSDDADDAGTVGPGIDKRQGRGGLGMKKRMNSKDGESEEQETHDEGHDAKRKPRKSARLA